jgi:tetratricopeptide (TPR) repeat protein
VAPERAVRLGAGLLLWACAAAVAWADQADPRLGPLFNRLRAAADEAAGKPVEAEIWRIWGETADPDSASLYARGVAAMNRGDGRAALAAFDLLVAREPGFAEAWNKRATLLYLLGDDEGSIANIRRTLALEPRHFGALSGLALIRARQGRPGEAARSLEAALAIHPSLPGGRARLRDLEEAAASEPT